jgi:uncharacterized protein (TIGR03067 family)
MNADERGCGSGNKKRRFAPEQLTSESPSMRRVLFSAVVGLIAQLAVGVCADDAGAKQDLEKLQGEWTMVMGEIEGQAMPEQMRATARRVAKDDETTITIGGQLFMKAKFTVDPSKSPKAIDYNMTGGPTSGKTQLGIYEIDGERVKFCFGSPGKERPTNFKTEAGDGRTLSVWARKKEP